MNTCEIRLIRQAMLLAAIGIGVCLATNPVQAAPLFHLTDLGLLPDYQESAAAAINDLGEVVGEISIPGDGKTRAFIWRSGQGMTDLGDLPGHFDYSSAADINNQGQVTGLADSSAGSPGLSPNRGFLWSQGSGMQDIGDLPTDTVHFTVARGINNSGQIVGAGVHGLFTGNGFANRAFVRSSTGVMQELGLPAGSDRASAAAINDAGLIVGSAKEDLYGYERALLWKPDGSFTDLGDLPGGVDSSVASDINELGQVVGSGTAADGRHAFLWTAGGGMSDLGVLPGGGIRSSASAINELGEVVGAGAYASNQYGSTAMYWSSGTGMLDLNNLLDASGAGWRLVFATDINSSGQIVGSAFSPTGETRAFLLTPVPEPSSLVLIALGLVAFALPRLRRRK
jgi:probable HAF family extracellular repeat protein